MLLYRLALLFALANVAKSCGNYKLVMEPIKDCQSNNVVQFHNISFTLDDNCQVIPSGCFTINKPFKTMKGKYFVKKQPMIEATKFVDLCKDANDPTKLVAHILSTVGYKCPDEKRSHCTNGEKKVSLLKFKNQMGVMAGAIYLKLDLTHDDDAAQSCFEINFSIVKK